MTWYRLWYSYSYRMHKKLCGVSNFMDFWYASDSWKLIHKTQIAKPITLVLITTRSFISIILLMHTFVLCVHCINTRHNNSSTCRIYALCKHLWPISTSARSQQARFPVASDACSMVCFVMKFLHIYTMYCAQCNTCNTSSLRSSQGEDQYL